MLIRFNFKNFKSFRDSAVLDMSASKITEHSDHVISMGKEKVLPISVIYGANASGKSNVYQAFEYMSDYIVNSFKFGGDDDSKQGSEFEYMKPTPFLFDSLTLDQESLFEIYFMDANDSAIKIYNYGFAVNAQGVTKEWLKSKSKTAKEFKSIFYRSKSENILDLNGLPAKYHENIRVSLENEVLIVSLGAKLKISKLKIVRDWFWSNEFADFGDPVESLFLSRMLPKGFVDDEKVQESVVKFFSSFDDSIIGFKIEKVLSDSDKKNEEHYKIDAIHKMVNSTENATIPLRFESDGTLKMFALYPRLQSVLEKGSTLFIDELNARLHPLLVRNFVNVFLDSNLNPNHAQLVFTTHDTWQLSNELLRRDEIWFVDKDKNGVSVLYTLADVVDQEGIKIRKDENYEKNYLQGKYNATPLLKPIGKIFQTDKGENK